MTSLWTLLFLLSKSTISVIYFLECLIASTIPEMWVDQGTIVKYLLSLLCLYSSEGTSKQVKLAQLEAFDWTEQREEEKL